MVALSTPMAAQRGQNMFGCGNQRALMVAQDGCEIGGDDGGRDGGNFTIGAGEDETRIDLGWTDRYADRRSRMNADARHGDLRPERCLPTRFHSRLPKSFSHPKSL